MKKSLFAVLLTACLCMSVKGEDSKPPRTLPGGWVYVWGDEFNGSRIDAKKWKPELGVIRNQGSQQTYTGRPKNMRLEDGCLVLETHLFFSRMAQPEHLEWEETPLLRQTADQLDEYFQGSRRVFDVPLSPQGTEFERTVWKALQAIPYGETRSYGDIARRIGRPSACRAVGQANNRNPVGIIIPCHRVIGADGKLTGYASGLTIKQYLLELEQGSATPFTLFTDVERMPGNTPASP